MDTQRTDFIAFYRELGVEPECTPDELKRAYRKRVSGLHPDRVGDRGGGEEALKALNLGYAAVLEFHRAHGRFPGAAMPRTAPATRSIVPGMQYGPPEPGDAPRARHPRWLLLALVLVVVVLVASRLMHDDTRAAEATPVAPPATPVPTTAPHVSRPPAPSLQVGMSRGEVLAILGAPVETHEDGRQWLYGPSWVRVICGQLSDWYSSPLKPLGGSRTRPGPADIRPEYQPRTVCADPAAGMAY